MANHAPRRRFSFISSLHLLSLPLILLHLSTPIYLSSLPPLPSLPLYLSRPRSDHNSSSLNRVVPLLLSPLIPLLLLAILAISRLIHTTTTTTTTTPPPSRFFFSPLLYNTILVHFTRLLLWIYSRVFVSTSHRGHFAASLVLSRPVSACLVCVCVLHSRVRYTLFQLSSLPRFHNPRSQRYTLANQCSCVVLGAPHSFSFSRKSLPSPRSGKRVH